MTEPKKPLRWQDLTGQERYQVIELMRRPEVNIQELCRTFGVSRQTLYRAAEQADKAAVSALEAANAELRAALIDLHAAVEALDGEADKIILCLEVIIYHTHCHTCPSGDFAH